MLIRYVSSNVLDPLRMVCNGLKVLIAEEEVDHFDLLKLNSLQAMKKHCDDAITVLNDLWTYDKLESGIMETKLKLKNAWSFLRDTMRPYRLPVKIFLKYERTNVDY